MKNNLLLLMAASTLLFTSCDGQVKPIGEGTLDLEKFSFNTKRTDLLPEKYKSKDYQDTYEIEINGEKENSIMFQRDSTFSNQFTPERKAIGLEYRQRNWGMDDQLAVFQGQYFQKINIASTLDGKIKALGCLADELTKSQAENLLKKLTSKYGASKTMKSSWNNKLTIHEWKEKDRIIRYVTSFTNENNTMKIVVDKTQGTISEGEKEPHYLGYLFIIDPALKSEVFGKMNTGDFVYINNESE
ncbi:hypothetical protein NG800_001470 [Epilithonimonas ginsengisoli]|uniref:Uncharacterized protein n=1 Tax=Epilithonimonas ginsengisoli TaxID=1245592 RepID=A0ABU4JD33_9FLAO|nr:MULTISPECIES: hypothetical protein [Chryseobacterium group]MBV6878535.1 hypothetical protein [Epilithonimonas sp. FP105]MDW8547560.1 hypothetical protein [Epilithonimonas ginsengisoli]